MTMNGFFRLMIRDDGTYLIVYPPTDGGQPCQPSEVLQYLDTYQIPYDKIAIYNVMKTFNEKKELMRLLLLSLPRIFWQLREGFILRSREVKNSKSQISYGCLITGV